MVNTMGTRETSQALTILGIVCNGFSLFFSILYAIYFFPIFIIMLIWFFFGIVLPIVGYNEIPRGSRGSAGAMLIISGIVSLLFIFFIAGILLIVAGAMVATWHPYPSAQRRYDLHWAPYPSSNQGNAYLVPASRATTKKCVNCGVELERIDQYCHACGTNVGWY